MNQSNFKKFCEDAGLIDKKFPKKEVATVFSASKSKGKNDISYNEFRKALGLIASKKGTTPAKVASTSSGVSPQTKGTTKGSVNASLEEKTGSVKKKGKKAVTDVPASNELKAVFTSFASFGQAAGSKRMNQSNWKKFCEDADLIDQKFPASDVALVFAAS